MSKEVSTWAQLLFTYGPFALLTLFVFVVERKTKKGLDGAPESLRSRMYILYLGTWLVIGGLTLYSCYTWHEIALSPERNVMVRFDKLKPGEDVLFDAVDQVYSRRIPNDDGTKDVESYWFPHGFNSHDITFTFVRGPDKRNLFRSQGLTNPPDLPALAANIPIRPFFFDKQSELRVRYEEPNGDKSPGELVLIYIENGEEKTEKLVSREISSQPSNGDSDHSGGQQAYVGDVWAVIFEQVVHAQSAFDQKIMTQRLQSEYPDVRDQARLDLAAQAPSVAVPYINSILQNSTMDGNVVYAAIWALNDIARKNPNIKWSDISPSAWDTVRRANTTFDHRLQPEAHQLLRIGNQMPKVDDQLLVEASIELPFIPDVGKQIAANYLRCALQIGNASDNDVVIEKVSVRTASGWVESLGPSDLDASRFKVADGQSFGEFLRQKYGAIFVRARGGIAYYSAYFSVEKIRKPQLVSEIKVTFAAPDSNKKTEIYEKSIRPSINIH